MSLSVQDSPADPADAERFQRLVRLYNEFAQELKKMEAEGSELSKKIQQAIDQQKINRVLNYINKQP